MDLTGRDTRSFPMWWKLQIDLQTFHRTLAEVPEWSFAD